MTLFFLFTALFATACSNVNQQSSLDGVWQLNKIVQQTNEKNDEMDVKGSYWTFDKTNGLLIKMSIGDTAIENKCSFDNGIINSEIDKYEIAKLNEKEMELVLNESLQDKKYKYNFYLTKTSLSSTLIRQFSPVRPTTISNNCDINIIAENSKLSLAATENNELNKIVWNFHRINQKALERKVRVFEIEFTDAIKSNDKTKILSSINKLKKDYELLTNMTEKIKTSPDLKKLNELVYSNYCSELTFLNDVYNKIESAKEFEIVREDIGKIFLSKKDNVSEIVDELKKLEKEKNIEVIN